MKSNDSTEMDRLIRRLAGRSRASLDAGIGDGKSALHLDADELNAYAEGALPPAARSRYFAHLADCDSCRKLVTDLTLAAVRADAAAERVASIEPSRKGTWREWMAAIFSPAVLRFAVPALALSAVIVIAIVATRTQRDSSSVAQKEESGKNYTPSITANSNASGEAPPASVERGKTGSNTTSANVQIAQATPAPAATPIPADPAGPPPLKTGRVEADAPKIPLADVARPIATPQSTVREDRKIGEVSQRPEEEISVDGARTPQPPPGTLSDTTARDKQADQKKAKVFGKDDDETVGAKPTGGVAVTESRQRESAPTTTARKTVPASPGNAGATRAAPRTNNEPADMAASKSESAEYRSVAGRRFYRRGSAWVDSAYRSSLPTTNVARGSEQYRGLVADEPGLKTVTQQLGGEVFVVWKSRAYRFY